MVLHKALRESLHEALLELYTRLYLKLTPATKQPLQHSPPPRYASLCEDIKEAAQHDGGVGFAKQIPIN